MGIDVNECNDNGKSDWIHIRCDCISRNHLLEMIFSLCMCMVDVWQICMQLASRTVCVRASNMINLTLLRLCNTLQRSQVHSNWFYYSSLLRISLLLCWFAMATMWNWRMFMFKISVPVHFVKIQLNGRRPHTDLLHVCRLSTSSVQAHRREN